MSISNNTRYLFVTTPTGIRQVNNPLAVPEVPGICLAVVGVAGILRVRRGV
jgi:hypothetical protein